MVAVARLDECISAVGRSSLAAGGVPSQVTSDRAKVEQTMRKKMGLTVSFA